MQLRTRDKKALQIAAAAIALFAILQFGLFPLWDSWQEHRANLPVRERTLAKYRAAVETASFSKTQADAEQARLRDAEGSLLSSTTPALAFAELQDAVKQLTAAQGIDLGSSEFLPIKPFGDEYTQVPLAINFQCRLDQLANLLSAMQTGTKSLSVPRLSIQYATDKDKRLNVAMTVAALMRAARPQP